MTITINSLEERLATGHYVRGFPNSLMMARDPVKEGERQMKQVIGITLSVRWVLSQAPPVSGEMDCREDGCGRVSLVRDPSLSTHWCSEQQVKGISWI